MRPARQSPISPDSIMCNPRQEFPGKLPVGEGIVQAKVTMTDFWIKQGWYKPMKDGGKKLTQADWRMAEGIRLDAVRFLVEKVLRKDSRDITVEDFNSNRLCGLLQSYYDYGPYAALKEAGYDFHPWEMLKTPNALYKEKSIRVAALHWLIEKLGKDPKDLAKEDFYSNRLGGLLTSYYTDSPYDALKEAGYNFHPWEMLNTPKHFYNSKDIRIAAIRWLVDKLKKDPRDITEKDFHSNRLSGLLSHYYNGSPYDALKEAGCDFHPWEMLKTPQGLYEQKKIRVAAVRWLVEKLKKDPRDITAEDFDSNRLCGLITNYYNHSPYEALHEAGLVTKADEAYMRSTAHTHDDSK